MRKFFGSRQRHTGAGVGSPEQYHHLDAHGAPSWNPKPQRFTGGITSQKEQNQDPRSKNNNQAQNNRVFWGLRGPEMLRYWQVRRTETELTEVQHEDSRNTLHMSPMGSLSPRHVRSCQAGLLFLLGVGVPGKKTPLSMRLGRK